MFTNRSIINRSNPHTMDRDIETLKASYLEERECTFEEIGGQGHLSIKRNEVTEGADGHPEPVFRRTITHHSNILGQAVYGSVNKVLWGRYNSHVACLLVVRFRFTGSKGLLRLRKAAIVIRFLENIRSKDQQLQETIPEIKAFSPGHLYGIPTEVEHEYVWDTAAQCSLSAGFGALAPEIRRTMTERYKTETALQIAGMSEPDDDQDVDNKVIFEVDENSKAKSGVPREIYFGAVVQCEGTIQADIQTSIGDLTAWPWTADDPIVIKPGITHGNVPETVPLDFEQLTDDHWRLLVPYRKERANVIQVRTD